jgi:hypothetical protein
MSQWIRTAVLALGLCSSASAQSFNIDFTDNMATTIPSASYGAGLNQPGVWNAWDGIGLFSPVDLSGAPTGVLVSVSGSGGASTIDWPGTTGDDERLIDDYLSLPSSGATVTVSFQNLAPGLYETITYGWLPWNVPYAQTGVWNLASTEPYGICGGTWNGTLAATPQAWSSHRQYISSGGVLTIKAQEIQLGGALNGMQVRGLPNAYQTNYCVGKVNSVGCVPSMVGGGYPSATNLNPYSLLLRGYNLVALKSGLMFYSLTGRATLPFQGGTLCVAPPVKRSPVLNSRGTGPGCNGSYSLDFGKFANGLLGGNPHPALLVPGTTINCQWWARDAGLSPNNTQLSNALEFVQGF